MSEDVCIPLSAIASFKTFDNWNVRMTLHMPTEGPKEIILKPHGSRFERCWIKRVIFGNVGPQLVLAKTANSLYENVVDISSIDEFVHDPLVIPTHPITLINHFTNPKPLTFLAKVTMTRLTDQTNLFLHNKMVHFLGYTQYNHAGSVLRALLVYHDRRYQVSVADIICFDFVRDL